jgi:type III pantothenate kinase
VKLLLCDVGNTSYHIFDGEKTYKKNVLDFNPQSIAQTIYYISVNTIVSKKLKKLDNWINVAPYINQTQYYETMGIDRICAVEAVKSAVVLDAGSAITVDVIKNTIFEGGFIYPGVDAMQKTYENISSTLKYSFNFDLDLDIMPKNSQDAISYGFLKTLYNEVTSYKLPIILTGGNAEQLQKIFKEATVDETLIFKGMQEIIKKAKLC